MSSEKNESSSNQSRRDFLKIGAIAGAGLALGSGALSGCGERGGGTNLAAEYLKGFRTDPIRTVRMGFVGTGAQGSSHVRNFLRIDGVEIKALCDIVEERAARNQERVVRAGQPKPDIYTLGDYDFKRLCDRDDIDLVFIALFHFGKDRG